MTTTDINFKISGPTLSLLLTDCEKSVSDQMGFLIGEKQNIITKTISDAEMSSEKMETTVNMNAPMPVGLPYVFCNNFGRVDRKNLKSLLGDLEKDVVGWYSFRRNSRHIPLLRETLLHRQLCEAFPHISPLCFTFCVITASRNNTGSTHSYKYSFLRHLKRKFEPISVPVSNLGEPMNNSCKETPVSNSSEIFHEILQSLSGLRNTETEEKVEIIEKLIQNKIMALAQRISENEEELKSYLEEEKQKRKAENIGDCTDTSEAEVTKNPIREPSSPVKCSFSQAVKKSESSPYVETMSQEY